MINREPSLNAKRLSGIEEELRVLKASVAHLSRKKRAKGLANLEGIWKGAKFSYAEIKDAEVKVP